MVYHAGASAQLLKLSRLVAVTAKCTGVWRSLGKRGSGQSDGQLGITRDTHNHILAPNPFIYKVHQKATLQYQQAVDLALGHRLAHQSYFGNVQSPRGLEFIDRSEYLL